jgi:hypothetical protein
MSSNTDRLHDAGLIADKSKLPKDHEAFLNDLSESDVTVLISIKERLDQAGIPVQPLGPPHQAMPVL